MNNKKADSNAFNQANESAFLGTATARMAEWPQSAPPPKRIKFN